MGGLLNKVVQLFKKLGYVALEYFYVAYHWCMRLMKIQMKRFAVSKARKQLEKAYSGLGAVVYGMLKEGNESLKGDPAVATQMKNVEEAEARMKEVDDQIQAINNDFAAKRQELAEKYQAKRAGVSEESSEEKEEG